jgi:glucan 1,3-beta-glucosidase
MGRRYTSTTGVGVYTAGYLSPSPVKPAGLLNSAGKIFEQSKPLYTQYAATDFVVATANGVSNTGKTDQHANINTLLANNVGKPIYFPAGVYLVESTINVPVNSIIVGEAWSQIMASGSYFQDATNPQVMVKYVPL